MCKCWSTACGVILGLISIQRILPFVSGCREVPPLEWHWYAWGWEGGKEPLLDCNTRLLTVCNEFCSFLSLLVLLKTHFTAETHFPGCAVCTHAYIGIEFELACILVQVVITLWYFPLPVAGWNFIFRHPPPRFLKLQHLFTQASS